MNPLREALADSLSLRRSLGYALRRPEKLRNQFLDYVEDRGASTITTDLAVAWAELPQDASPRQTRYWRSSKDSDYADFGSSATPATSDDTTRVGIIRTLA